MMNVEVCDRRKMRIESIHITEANVLVKREHYLHREVYATGNVCYKISYEGIEAFGVIIYGFPVFHDLGGLVESERNKCGCPFNCHCGTEGWLECGWVAQKTFCSRCGGKGWRGHIVDDDFICPGCMHGRLPREAPLKNGELVELKRVWLPFSFPKNSESCAVALTLDALKKDWPPKAGSNSSRRNDVILKAKIVVSYADTEIGHDGTIYMASGFREMGVVNGRKLNSEGRHGRWHEKEGAPKGNTGAGKIMYMRVLDWNYHMDWFTEKFRQR